MESSLKDLKAIERRKSIRKYIRQGLKEVEMAEKLNVDPATISGDVQIIRRENIQRLLANKQLIQKDVENLLRSLQILEEIDLECWKIYYEEKVEYKDGVEHKVPVNNNTKLEALEKIRTNNKDRAQLLKLLNPTQISIEKITYIENLVPVVIQKYTDIVLEFVPKEKQVELLEKLKVINIEKEIYEDGK